jgi:hypothetical protein
MVEQMRIMDIGQAILSPRATTWPRISLLGNCQSLDNLHCIYMDPDIHYQVDWLDGRVWPERCESGLAGNVTIMC